MSETVRPGAGPSGLLVLDLDQSLAGHVAMAMLQHAKWAASSGMRLPGGWAELFETFTNGARRGQAGTAIAPFSPTHEVSSVTARLMTYAEAARLLAVSERTVKRLVAAGTLPVVRIGAMARLRVTDIDTYLTTLTEDAC